jgi:electron transport complex protein RnfG
MENSKSSFAAPVIVLSCICLCVSLALAFTYKVANPIIIQNNQKAADEARTEILPDADAFTQIEDVTAENGVRSADDKAGVTEAFKADNGAGYVMTVVTKSFGGDLTMMVGMDAEGAITGVKVTEHADTPGVGTKNMEADYLKNYAGLNELGNPDIKKESFVISGASVSGQAIHSGVAAALSQFAAMGGAQ